jgi:hypothetical protein
MKISLSAFALLCMLATSAAAHELQDNRATLVLRDSQHLSLTLFVDYAKVLHQVLLPQSTLQEFMLVHSAMKPQEFQAQLLAAQRKLQGGTSIIMGNGKTVALTQWVWPDAASVHKLLQQRAMQAVVAPNDHAHRVPMEIRAEAKSSNASDLKTVTLQLPAELQQVLVVSYQPKQVWLKPGAPAPVIRFLDN